MAKNYRARRDVPLTATIAERTGQQVVRRLRLLRSVDKPPSSVAMSFGTGNIADVRAQRVYFQGRPNTGPSRYTPDPFYDLESEIAILRGDRQVLEQEMSTAWEALERAKGKGDAAAARIAQSRLSHLSTLERRLRAQSAVHDIGPEVSLPPLTRANVEEELAESGASYERLARIEHWLSDTSELYRFEFEGQKYDAIEVTNRGTARQRAFGGTISPIADSLTQLSSRIDERLRAGEPIRDLEITQKRLRGLMSVLAEEARRESKEPLVEAAWTHRAEVEGLVDALRETRAQIMSDLGIYGVKEEDELLPLSSSRYRREWGLDIESGRGAGAALPGMTLQQIAAEQVHARAVLERAKVGARESDRERARILAYGQEPVRTGRVVEGQGIVFASQEATEAILPEPGSFVRVGDRPYKITSIDPKTGRYRLSPVVQDLGELDMEYSFRLRPGSMSELSLADVGRLRSFAEAIGAEPRDVARLVVSMNRASQDLSLRRLMASYEETGTTASLESRDVMVKRFAHQTKDAVKKMSMSEALGEVLGDKSVRIVEQATIKAIEGDEILREIYQVYPLAAQVMGKYFPQMVRFDDPEQVWDFAQTIARRITEEASVLPVSDRPLTHANLAEMLVSRVMQHEDVLWAEFFGERATSDVRDVLSLQRLISQETGEYVSDYEEFSRIVREYATGKDATPLVRRLGALLEAGELEPAFYDAIGLHGITGSHTSIDVAETVIEAQARAAEEYPEESETHVERLSGSRTYSEVEETADVGLAEDDRRVLGDVYRIRGTRSQSPETDELVVTATDAASPRRIARAVLAHVGFSGELSPELQADAEAFVARMQERELITREQAAEVYRELETVSRAESARRRLPEGVTPIREGREIVGFRIKVTSLDQLRNLMPLEELLRESPAAAAMLEREVRAGGSPVVEITPSSIVIGGRRFYVSGKPLELSPGAVAMAEQISAAEAYGTSVLPQGGPNREIPVYRRLGIQSGAVRWIDRTEAEPLTRDVLRWSESGALDNVPVSVVDIETYGKPEASGSDLVLHRGFGITEIGYTRPGPLMEDAEVVTFYVRPTEGMRKHIAQQLAILEADPKAKLSPDVETSLRHVMKYSTPEWETAPITRQAVEQGLEFLEEHGVSRVEALSRFAKETADAQVFVGHNITRFDIPIIERLSRGLKTAFQRGQRTILDTFQLVFAYGSNLSRILTGRPLAGYELSDVAGMLGHEVGKGAHRTGADVATARAVARDLVPGGLIAQAVTEGDADLRPLRIGDTLIALKPSRRQGEARVRVKDYYTIVGWQLRGDTATIDLEDVGTGERASRTLSYPEMTKFIHETFLPEEVDQEIVERVIADRARKNYYRSIIENPLGLAKRVHGHAVVSPRAMINMAIARGAIEAGDVATLESIELSPEQWADVLHGTTNWRRQLSKMSARAAQERPLIEAMLENIEGLYRTGHMTEKEAVKAMRAFMRDIERAAPAGRTFRQHPLEQEVTIAGRRFNTYARELIGRDIAVYQRQEYRRFLPDQYAKMSRRQIPEEVLRTARARALWDLAEQMHDQGFLTEDEWRFVQAQDVEVTTPVKDVVTRALLRHGEEYRAARGTYAMSEEAGDFLDPRPQEAIDELLRGEKGSRRLDALVRQHTARYARRQATPRVAEEAPPQKAPTTKRLLDVLPSIREALEDPNVTQETKTALTNLLRTREILEDAEYTTRAGQAEDAANRLKDAMEDAGQSRVRGSAGARIAEGLMDEPLSMKMLRGAGRIAPMILLPVAIGGALRAFGAFFTNAPLSVDKQPKADQAPAPDGTYSPRAMSAPQIRQMMPRSYVTPDDSGYGGIRYRVRARSRERVNPEDIQAAMAASMNQAIPVPVNLNMSINDNLSDIDEQWLDSKIAEVLSR